MIAWNSSGATNHKVGLMEKRIERRTSGAFVKKETGFMQMIHSSWLGSQVGPTKNTIVQQVDSGMNECLLYTNQRNKKNALVFRNHFDCWTQLDRRRI